MVIISLLGSVFLSLVLIISNLLPVYAIYYGKPEKGFLFSGFIIVDMGNENYGQCGINFISDKVGVTAAHCLENAMGVYAGIGEFTQDFKDKAIKASNFGVSPSYNNSTFEVYPGSNDVGVVVFDKPVQLSEYAAIQTPRAGCDYFMVGYGRNENEEELARKSTEVCIKNITDYGFELDFPSGANFCNGDSGSGVYKKGTSSLVGTISAFYTDLSTESCVGASAYIVTRTDDNINFVEQFVSANTIDIDEEEKVETVPDDYFGEYHPETINDDGTFNYNNKIEIEIEKLSKLFDEIYPDEDVVAVPDPQVSPADEYQESLVGPDDGRRPIPSVTPFRLEQEIPDSERRPLADDGAFDFSNNQDQSQNAIIFVICGAICCLGIVGIIILIIVLRKRKKNENPVVPQTTAVS